MNILRRFILRDQSVRERAASEIASAGISDPPLEVIVRPYAKSRTQDQNDMMWPLLREIAKHVDWYGQKLNEVDWKTIFVAAIRKQRAVPGIDGGFVILGESSRTLTVREFSDLLDLIQAFAVERGVDLGEAVAA